jgi:hypothetical protein
MAKSTANNFIVMTKSSYVTNSTSTHTSTLEQHTSLTTPKMPKTVNKAMRSGRGSGKKNRDASKDRQAGGVLHEDHAKIIW